MRRLVTAAALVALLSVGGVLASARRSADAAMASPRVDAVHRIVVVLRSLGIGFDVGSIGGNEWGGHPDGSTI